MPRTIQYQLRAAPPFPAVPEAAHADACVSAQPGPRAFVFQGPKGGTFAPPYPASAEAAHPDAFVSAQPGPRAFVFFGPKGGTFAPPYPAVPEAPHAATFVSAQPGPRLVMVQKPNGGTFAPPFPAVPESPHPDALVFQRPRIPPLFRIVVQAGGFAPPFPAVAEAVHPDAVAYQSPPQSYRAFVQRAGSFEPPVAPNIVAGETVTVDKWFQPWPQLDAIIRRGAIPGGSFDPPYPASAESVHADAFAFLLPRQPVPGPVRIWALSEPPIFPTLSVTETVTVDKWYIRWPIPAPPTRRITPGGSFNPPYPASPEATHPEATAFLAPRTAAPSNRVWALSEPPPAPIIVAGETVTVDKWVQPWPIVVLPRRVIVGGGFAPPYPASPEALHPEAFIFSPPLTRAPSVSSANRGSSDLSAFLINPDASPHLITISGSYSPVTTISGDLAPAYAISGSYAPVTTITGSV